MTIYFQANPGTRLGTDSRVFLYEIAIRPQKTECDRVSGLNYRRGKIYLKVPYAQMNSTREQIARQGGKILSITPLTEKSPVSLSPSPITNPIPKPPLKLTLPWWVEISTAQPHCLYYFGPFDSADEAQFHQAGYIEDLKAEGAEGISLQIKQCQPHALTQEW